jgi:hypothetical protein
LLAVRLENDPQMRIGRRRGGRDSMDLPAKALIIYLAQRPNPARARPPL